MAGLELSGGRFLGRFDWVRADRNELHFRNVFHFTAPANLAGEWLHVVASEDEDDGLAFRFYWLDRESAGRSLAGEQGAYLSSLSR